MSSTPSDGAVRYDDLTKPENNLPTAPKKVLKGAFEGLYIDWLFMGLILIAGLVMGLAATR